MGSQVKEALLGLLLIAAPVAAEPAPALPPPAVEGQGRAILITGASSGFGRRLTEILSEKGWFVCAGARQPEDIAALDAMKNVQALKLDVNSQTDVDMPPSPRSRRAAGGSTASSTTPAWPSSCRSP
jgi:hypothetical protein